MCDGGEDETVGHAALTDDDGCFQSESGGVDG